MTPFQATQSGNIDAWIIEHLRDDPVQLVPSKTWGVEIVVGAMFWIGALRLRSRA